MFRKIIFAIAAFTLTLGSITAWAQDNGALLDLLVRKRIITDQEAEDIRGTDQGVFRDCGGKAKALNARTELEIYGDARMRYEIRSAESGAPDTLTPPGENTSAIARVTAFGSESAGRWSMIGFLDCALRLAQIPDRLT